MKNWIKRVLTLIKYRKQTLSIGAKSEISLCNHYEGCNAIGKNTIFHGDIGFWQLHWKQLSHLSADWKIYINLFAGDYGIRHTSVYIPLRINVANILLYNEAMWRGLV